jgi:hypothetical protein
MTDNNAVPSAGNTLTQVFLGFETQAQRMTEANPTFVSMWAGNNDVLASLTNLTNPGDPLFVTTQGSFDAAYDAAATAIDNSTARGALLVGVVDVTNIPYSSTGSTLWCLKTGLCGFPAAAFPAIFTVDNSCAPNAAIPGMKGDSVLVPWPKYLGLIALASPPTSKADTLSCTSDNTVVTPTEYANMRNAVVGFNAKIQAVATAHNWAFWDPNPTLDSLKTVGEIPLFPNIAAPSVNFGPWISLDGVHPNAAAQKLIANRMRRAINAAYGTSMPNIP